MQHSVLIIGAKGMLGGMLSRVFEDLDPVCLDKEDMDIVDIDSVRSRIRSENPRVVINAAAYTDVDGAESDRDTAFAVNETGAGNLARVANEIGATIVHYSTDYVFSGDPPQELFSERGAFLGYPEHWSPGPAINVYGQSKLAGERAIIQSGAQSYIIRTAWLYGPGGPNFVETMIALAEKHPELSVVHDQKGCPTYTHDVARYTRALLEGEYAPGIYHAVNGGVASWFDFASKIFEHMDFGVIVKKTSSDAFPRPAKRPTYSVLQNTKGPAMRLWERALAEYISTR